GKVVDIAPDRKSVTLDHEDIPGLMKAMKMKFRIADAKLLDGVQPGDTVRGRLKVQDGDYVITHLEKLRAAAPDKKEATAHFYRPMHPYIVQHRPGTKCPICGMPLSKLPGPSARLDPEDERLASAQGYCCPIKGESLLLFSRGRPVKVTVKGQPVLLCCKDCA